MNDPRQQLIGCFTAVFPILMPESVTTATIDTVPSWDSAHHFMLMQVIEERFSIRIPEVVLGEMNSFEDFERYLDDLQRKV
jgi:acyl carrier protein